MGVWKSWQKNRNLGTILWKHMSNLWVDLWCWVQADRNRFIQSSFCKFLLFWLSLHSHWLYQSFDLKRLGPLTSLLIFILIYQPLLVSLPCLSVMDPLSISLSTLWLVFSSLLVLSAHPQGKTPSLDLYYFLPSSLLFWDCFGGNHVAKRLMQILSSFIVSRPQTA